METLPAGVSTPSEGSSTPRASAVSVATAASDKPPQILPFDMATDSDSSAGLSGDDATDRMREYCYLPEAYPLFIISIDNLITTKGQNQVKNAGKVTLKPSHKRKSLSKLDLRVALRDSKKKKDLQSAKTGRRKLVDGGEWSGSSTGFTETHTGVVVNQTGDVILIIRAQCAYVDWQ